MSWTMPCIHLATRCLMSLAADQNEKNIHDAWLENGLHRNALGFFSWCLASILKRNLDGSSHSRQDSPPNLSIFLMHARKLASTFSSWPAVDPEHPCSTDFLGTAAPRENQVNRKERLAYKRASKPAGRRELPGRSEPVVDTEEAVNG